jgi:hypothetical protein
MNPFTPLTEIRALGGAAPPCVESIVTFVATVHRAQAGIEPVAEDLARTGHHRDEAGRRTPRPGVDPVEGLHGVGGLGPAGEPGIDAM